MLMRIFVRAAAGLLVKFRMDLLFRRVDLS